MNACKYFSGTVDGVLCSRKKIEKNETKNKNNIIFYSV